MHGYIFANNPVFVMCLDDKVIWYVNTYGAASHFSICARMANVIAALAVMPSVSMMEFGKTLVMDAIGGGMWQVICHVDTHQAMGMVANYRVYHDRQCPLHSLS